MRYDTRTLNLIKTLLIERSLTISAAESSTGGLLSDHLTHLPGSSIFFKGGIIAYANDVKRGILSIPPDMIKISGAVSSEVALAMAKEIRTVLTTEIGLSITGITGPDGGTEEKPVGLTYIGISASNFNKTKRYILKGSREEIRIASVQKALQVLHDFLLKELKLPSKMV